MNRQRALAVELMMSYPDSVVAEMLGVRLKTLLRWIAMPDFAAALKDRERQQTNALARIARQAALRAAAALCEATTPPAKPDPKVMLETLKLSGAYEIPDTDPAGALAEIVSRVMADEQPVPPHEQRHLGR